MATTHSLSPLLPAAHAGSLSSPSPVSRPQTAPIILQVPHINRRAFVVGLGSALWSWNAVNGNEEAMAAARRPPPPPVAEKKDPNVSGVQAKVLASKKRKEAMRASMAKLREKGKPVVVEEEPSSSSAPVVAEDEQTSSVSDQLYPRKRVLAQLEDDVVPCESQMENWKTTLQVMAAKEEQYIQQYNKYEDKALAALAIEDKKRQFAAVEKYIEEVLQCAL